ncbi:COMM domain-containing protein 8 isoform X2 [Hypanus sabinus]|uniref:COMM domain-containing protein 8 isoform X2 n=1 Tax=Hypanus sabinus TaxID=79690 RepID=UPI0028C441CF|nr:COMM domain-containing protein 8 isoform X2 [Hypanus sabinus]
MPLLVAVAGARRDLGKSKLGTRRARTRQYRHARSPAGRAHAPVPPCAFASWACGRACWPGLGSARLPAKMARMLGKLAPEDCPRFIHRVIDGICGRAFPRFRDYGNVWSLVEWMEVLGEATTFVKHACSKHLSDEEVQQLMNGLSASHQEAVLSCLKARKDELRRALIEKTNNMSSAQLQDFDWQLKLPLSSDKIAFLQIPLLNLDLSVKENGVLKPVTIEMDKEELQTLIHSLEAANKVL